MSDIIPIGIMNFRDRKLKFGMKRKDRRSHMYILGKSGFGKTTLIENMISEDIRSGEGVGFLDPHGDSARKILSHIPKNRLNDVVYFNPADLDYPIAFNVIDKVPWEHRSLVVSSLMSVFKKIWIDAWSPRMEYILTNTLLALMEWPDSTLLEVNRLLGDKDFRKTVVSNLKDVVVKNFFENEFAKYQESFRTEAVAAIQNKVGQFITTPLIRNIIGQNETAFNFREIMDGKKIFIANLSEGAIGETNSSLLGGLLITKMQLATMSRVDVLEEKRSDFYLYVDEFQKFATESFVNVLAEARKYRLNLIMAHQYLEQVDETVMAAILGNVGTMIIFRIGPADAEILEKELDPVFTLQDLVNLSKFSVYVKMIVDDAARAPFSAHTLPPIAPLEHDFAKEVVSLSRSLYGRKRSALDAEFQHRFRSFAPEPPPRSFARQNERGGQREALHDRTDASRPRPSDSAHGGEQGKPQGYAPRSQAQPPAPAQEARGPAAPHSQSTVAPIQSKHQNPDQRGEYWYPCVTCGAQVPLNEKPADSKTIMCASCQKKPPNELSLKEALEKNLVEDFKKKNPN